MLGHQYHQFQLKSYLLQKCAIALPVPGKAAELLQFEMIMFGSCFILDNLQDRDHKVEKQGDCRGECGEGIDPRIDHRWLRIDLQSLGNDLNTRYLLHSCCAYLIFVLFFTLADFKA